MKKYFLLCMVSMLSFNTILAESNSIEPSAIEIKDEFKKVASSELTPPVIEQILKEYPTSKLGAVYKNQKGQFKLIMVLQSGARRTVYIDQYGRWFNP